MNNKQRTKNRKTAKTLAQAARAIQASQHTCKECGEKGYHWVSTTPYWTLEEIINGTAKDDGFWTCSKFYDPETKRRIVVETPIHAMDAAAYGILGMVALNSLKS